MTGVDSRGLEGTHGDSIWWREPFEFERLSGKTHDIAMLHGRSHTGLIPATSIGVVQKEWYCTTPAVHDMTACTTEDGDGVRAEEG